MKLPSLRQVLADSRRTFWRFPLVILTALIGTGAAIVLIDYEGPPGPTVLFNILCGALLGIPVLTAGALLAEKMRWRRTTSLPAHGIALALLVAYAWVVPTDLANAPAIHILRLLVLAVGAHMLVAVAPFLSKGEVNGFWHFNKTLFLRILVALLYAQVLFAGLGLALGALDNLFGLDVPGRRYAELWAFLAGFFTTVFFLAGVPEDLRELDRRADYPKGLKVFTQYILLPIVLVYLVILYAYIAKILISWEWPQGWVSKLILGFSGTGLFALLLLHPLSGRTDNQWIRNAPRWFSIVSLPLIAMLFLAVARRVGEYGITEGRYLAMALGLWLLLVAAYFLISRSPNIKLIPASLCLLSLLVSFGPWSAFAVSEGSQVERLRRLLVKNRMLPDEIVAKAGAGVPFKDVREISAILSYLHDFHGYAALQPWFTEDLRENPAESELRAKSPAAVAGILGIEYVSRWQGSVSGIFLLVSDHGSSTNISGYEHILHGQHVASAGVSREFDGKRFSYRTGDRIDSLTFMFVSPTGVRDSVFIDLRITVDGLLDRYGNANTEKIPPAEMSIEREGDLFGIRLSLWQIKVEKQPGGARVLFFDADILYRLKGVAVSALPDSMR